jgi:hypothetical protein
MIIILRSYSQLIFTINFSVGHYLPCKTYCIVLACIKAIFYIRPLRFYHDLANI